MERIIRKRKRKNADQLEILNGEFDRDPHWSKERLCAISSLTGLSEGQVYKWGWDQKRKKFGVQEAERMRQIEHQMDQANAARRQQFMMHGVPSVMMSSEKSSEAELSSLHVEPDSDGEKYRTPIQAPARRRTDSDKQKALLSTQPETIQKPQPREITERKRDKKAASKQSTELKENKKPSVKVPLVAEPAKRVLRSRQV